MEEGKHTLNDYVLGKQKIQREYKSLVREENYTVIKTVVYPHYLDYYTSGAANSNAFRGRGSTYINEESRKHTSYPKRGDHHLA